MGMHRAALSGGLVRLLAFIVLALLGSACGSDSAVERTQFEGSDATLLADTSLEWPVELIYEVKTASEGGVVRELHQFSGRSWEDWEDVLLLREVDGKRTGESGHMQQMRGYTLTDGFALDPVKTDGLDYAYDALIDSFPEGFGNVSTTEFNSRGAPGPLFQPGLAASTESAQFDVMRVAPASDSVELDELGLTGSALTVDSAIAACEAASVQACGDAVQQRSAHVDSSTEVPLEATIENPDGVVETLRVLDVK